MEQAAQSVEVKVQRWWASLTHWFNGVGLTLIGLVGPAADALPSLQPYVGPQFYKYAFIGLAVGNMVIHQIKANRQAAAPGPAVPPAS